MKSYWMWYPGDYEIYHTMLIHMRRDEREQTVPAFWKMSSPEVNVTFSTVAGGGKMTAYSNGEGYVQIDNKRLPLNKELTIPEGEHKISVSAAKPGGLPAVYVESDVCPSGDLWKCNAHNGDALKVGFSKHHDSLDKTPEIFPFEYKTLTPVSKEEVNGGYLYDYGCETFCRINVKGICENTLICYGESREEALDGDNCIIFEYVKGDKTLKARAFRYIYVNRDIELEAEFEYLPLVQRGDFKCNNPLINQIYNTSVYTFYLNCRECFLDGIKRDRWVWSGDAYQSGKINAYLYADRDIVKRTALGLFGKSPVVQHINTIIDYSFFWIIGLFEYYITYGDIEFLKDIFPRAVELISFCESRKNSDGFIEGIKNDWTFIDWSDFDMTGAMSAEQILFVAAYRAMANIAEAIGENGDEYLEKAKALNEKIDEFYWNEELGGYIDSYSSGKNHITRHANIFAILYGIASPERTRIITEKVLKNDNITKITTPYFKGYELDVLAMLGEFDAVEKEIVSYWGEMIKLGATSIWEEFDPEKRGVEHYGMYSDKFGKSLCHAWGAGSVYIFGKYYMGVSPTAPGYETFKVEPIIRLGGFEGRVPVRDGEVKIRVTDEYISVTSTASGGIFVYKGQEYPLNINEEIRRKL
ncbi:MAG: alpha-rhamnosidase [Ruminococcaceae bacterium]|nr:alpha-rhamnosidase [Oscillospiraceae bacterium]